jgi:sugar/nucleoside kinase (ribokinase family)
MATIIAFGNPVYDDITTPTLTTGGRVLSGCSTNGCLALARLGHTTALVGTLGADFYARFQADLQRYGVQGYVEQAAETGGFRLIYDQRGDRTLDLLGVAAHISTVPARCAQADAIIIGPILQETPVALVERIRSISDAPLFLDPQGLMRRVGVNGRIEHYCDAAIARMAPLCYVVKANEVEARVLTGIDPREDAASSVRALKALGPQIAIVTLAEAGSIIDDGTRQWRIPAYATLAHDPTGAGDTYMAGFIHGQLQRPDDLFYAGCVGSATASIWIEHTGPDAPITLDEVIRRTDILLGQRAS